MLSQIARWCEARLIGDDREVAAVSNDTRTLAAGSLYVALRGERFDGHDYCVEAAARGAAALLVQREVNVALPQLRCGDTVVALGELAAGAQQGRRATMIALTGSNGKTTVKTLLQGILARVGEAYANPGNRNNEIGLPLAVLDAPEDARFAIYEMGAGKPGDIAYLTSIVRPRIALVNNIAAAHLQRMGTLLGVAQTKSALYQALPTDGVAVINADDAFAPWFEARIAGPRLLRFGLDTSAQICARELRSDGAGSRFRLIAPDGEIDIALPLPGRHNVLNALAASALALAAGAALTAVQDGLQAVQAMPGRQLAHLLRSGATLIDDSYNANPGSVAAAIDALGEAQMEAWLVLGDMKELGEGAELLHAEVGARARDRGVARLYTVGPLARAASRAFGDGARHLDDQAALIAALRGELRANVRCLIKGSRSSAMDRVVAALLADDANGDGQTRTGHAA